MVDESGCWEEKMTESKGLLKFCDEKAFLVQEGIDLLQSLPGRIFPIILMGDGRAGKSYLGSRILDQKQAFLSSASAEPVTEGVDIFLGDLRGLVKGLPNKVVSTPLLEDDRPCHILLLDCEGGNNAMAAIRTLVNVFGMIIGTQVLFVTGGTLSESALQNLDATIAARSLIKLEGEEKPDQRLFFIVNKNTLNYDENALEVALNTKQKDEGRQAARDMVKEAFQQRSFLTIPDMEEDTFESKISDFRRKVFQDSRTLKMGGVEMSGKALASVLQIIVTQMQDLKEVSMPSMNRAVIVDGFLQPLADRLVEEAEAKAATWTDYVDKLEEQDLCQAASKEFADASSRIKQENLKQEVKQGMIEKITCIWDTSITKNTALGEQTLSAEPEMSEEKGKIEKQLMGGKGKLRFVKLSRQQVQVRSRTVVMRKNGRREESEWENLGETKFNILEDLFTGMKNNVPVLQGRLLKNSPSCCLKMWCCCCGGGWQGRRFAVREGFIMWWDDRKVKEPERSDENAARAGKLAKDISGCLSLWHNDIKIKQVDKETLSISPKGKSWGNAKTFTGGATRVFLLKTGTKDAFGSHYHSAAVWKDIIEKNYTFACSAREQLGKARVDDEISDRMPKLLEATWEM